MKKFNATGFTVASVLGIALLGGVAGGALVLGDDGQQAAPRPVQMGLKVAEEATTAPSAAPSATPAPAEATLEPSAPAPVQAPANAQEEPVATTPTETAREAADRAEKAAKRAEDAAAKVTPTPSPSPVAVKPAPTPAPPIAPRCEAGSVQNIGRFDEQVCSGGNWVSAAPNRHCKLSNPTEYVASGSTTKRTLNGGREITYKCQDGQLTIVDDTTGE